MKNIILFICLTISFNLKSGGEHDDCDCQGYVLLIQTPIENFINLGMNMIYIQCENGTPAYFQNKMRIEVPRLTPDNSIICKDVRFSSYYVSGSVIGSTTNTMIDGDCSIRMVDPYDPDPKVAAAPGVTYQKQHPTAGIFESDVSINPFYPHYSNIGDYATSLSINPIVDGGTVIRHELGHLYGADHDPDNGTLMHPNLFFDEVKDIDCDIQDAYSKIYTCSAGINRSSCSKLNFLNQSYVKIIRSSNIEFTELNSNIKTIYLFKKTNNSLKIIEKGILKDNKIQFNIKDRSNLYFQIIYENNMSALYKI